jgi:hypothetical protein
MAATTSPNQTRAWHQYKAPDTCWPSDYAVLSAWQAFVGLDYPKPIETPAEYLL